jgi:hypothetical protein
MTILEHFFWTTLFFNISPHSHSISNETAVAEAGEWSKNPVKMWIFHDFQDFGDQNVKFRNFCKFSDFLKKSEKNPEKIPKFRKKSRKIGKKCPKNPENLPKKSRKCGYFMIFRILGTKK